MTKPLATKSRINRADLLYTLLKHQGNLSASQAQSLGFIVDPDYAPHLKENEEEDTEKAAKTDGISAEDQIANKNLDRADEKMQSPIPDVSFWQPISCEFFQLKPPAEPVYSYQLPKPAAQSAPTGKLWTQPHFPKLATFNQLIPRLRQALSQKRTARSYHLKKITQALGRGKWLSRLPKNHRKGWGAGLYVITDNQTYLTPYYADQQMVKQQLSRVFNQQSYHPAYFQEGMHWPCLEQTRQPLSPNPGDQILVLGDLGCLAADSGQSQTFWQHFGADLNARGIGLIALLPCHPQECSNELQPYYTLLSWEHPAPEILSPKVLQQRGTQLLSHLSICSRIEPGLLREIRLALGAKRYPARLEAWIWQHPHMDQPDRLATSLKPEYFNPYQQRFEQQTQQRETTLRLVKKWLTETELSDEFWLQTILTLGDWADKAQDNGQPLVTHHQRQAAYRLLEYLVQREQDHHNAGYNDSTFSDSQWCWIHLLVDSLHPQTRRQPETQYPLQVLQKALKKRQQDHDSKTTPTQASAYHNTGPLILCHRGHQWIINPTPKNHEQTMGQVAEHGVEQAPEQNPEQTGSPIATLHSQDGFIRIEPEFWLSGHPPKWAVDWGHDNYGPWVVFEIQGYRQKMRWIPPGEFIMGSPKDEPGRRNNEGPQHRVIIHQGYWLFDTPVTQALWQAVMGTNPSKFQSPQRPVETVDWNDAQTFIQILNQKMPGLVLSLPSEAQWEYACRAGTDTAIYSGTLEILGEYNAPALDNIAWYGGNSGVDFTLENGYDTSHWSEKQYPDTSQAGTHPVAQKQANPWGLYDMLGNVWEWTSDHWHNNYQGAPKNGEAWLDPEGQEQEPQRVLRGGSWGSNAGGCRSASRVASAPDERFYDIGFRCACVQDTPVAEPGNCGGVSRAEPDSETRRNGRGVAAQLTHQATAIKLKQNLTRHRLLSLVSDQQRLLLQKISLPTWASAMGRDRYGLWAEMTLASDQDKVVQRLRWIPPGRFLMGSPKDEPERRGNEGPQHEVTLSKGYWLFDTPVTQALWQAVMGKNPSKFHSPKRPVERVSWNDTQTFIHTLNQKIPGLVLSLPSEAQWEYACRAGTQTALYHGDIKILGDANAPALDNIAWYGGNSGEEFDLEKGMDITYFDNRQSNKNPSGTHRVAVKLANNWGLYDMLGNVWEWTADHWHNDYQGAPEDGRAWLDPKGQDKVTQRVLRGGSWDSSASLCRSATRDAFAPGWRSSDIGFRCACVQEQ